MLGHEAQQDEVTSQASRRVRFELVFSGIFFLFYHGDLLPFLFANRKELKSLLLVERAVSKCSAVTYRLPCPRQTF